MADIFISYSSSDRLKTEKLAAFLESKGYTVWFDKALEPADHYRDAIMSEIDAARIVICIWTPHSIKSDWCRAEANRARVAGKLVPVRLSDLAHDQIPLPFGELHTILLEDEAQIERAIVRQLLVPPAPWYRRIWGGAKYEAMTWFSVIGIVLTLTRGLLDLMTYSGLLTKFTDDFLQYSQIFWSNVFFFLPEITLYDSVLLNLGFFFFVLFATSCSRSYPVVPTLSEKYLRDNLFAAVAAFIIVNMFALTAANLQQEHKAESYLFSNMVSFVAIHLLGGTSSVSVIAARILILLGLYAVPVVVTLRLGFGYDPAKAAIRLWRIVGGIVALGAINLAQQYWTKTVS